MEGTYPKILLALIAVVCIACGGGDDMVSDVSVEVHSRVSTILVVSWTQDDEADNVWLEFTFENDEWYESPPMPGNIGEHTEVILGVPSETEVTFHIVSEVGQDRVESGAYTGITGELQLKRGSHRHAALIKCRPAKTTGGAITVKDVTEHVHVRAFVSRVLEQDANKLSGVVIAHLDQYVLWCDQRNA